MTEPVLTTPRLQLHAIGRRRAWAIWLGAVSVYVLAVFHRSSLGVAGLLAAERFDVAATQLASFTVLQLVVYAAMQVPVGVLLDRYGPRALLLSGLVLMTCAQVAFAFVHSYGAAVVARGLVGAGDAMVFVTVIRVVNAWFRPGQVPMLTQVTGWSGQLGAIAAATPLTVMLDHLGWTATFGATSTLGVVLLVAVLCLVKDSPFERVQAGPVTVVELARSVRTVWANPGTRLGFWVHFCTPFSANLLTMLWGYPFFVKGEGRTPGEAGLLLSLMVLTFIVAGPVIGWYIKSDRSHVVL